MKPVIGITLDHEKAGGYSEFPWYALRQNYFDAVAKAGGTPVALPYHLDLVDGYLDCLHGVLIPGGFFDIDPIYFGASEVHQTVTTKQHRTDFDLALTRGALERGLPFLGICAGEQLLNVLRGGSLIQHIPDAVPGALIHEQEVSKDKPTHSIVIEPGTLLYDIAGSSKGMVNSTHHQAIKELGAGLSINARAPDGIIEGVEDPAYNFCLGVQWHPEYLSTSLDCRIFERFVKEAAALR